MTAKIFRLRSAPPRGYSLSSSIDMDGEPLWLVTLADSEGVVHDEWIFLDEDRASGFLTAKLREFGPYGGDAA